MDKNNVKIVERLLIKIKMSVECIRLCRDGNSIKESLLFQKKIWGYFFYFTLINTLVLIQVEM